jgi:hypothetical protein
MTHSIVGLFPDGSLAERAIGDLKVAGFETAHLGSVTRDGEGASYLQYGVEPRWVFVTVEAQGGDAEARQMLLHAGAQRLGPEGSGASADEDTIGGVAPSAVSDAPPVATMPPIGDIGGVAPSAVTGAPPPADQDTLAHRPPTAPADTTIVSPGVETPYIQRQDRAGQTAAGRPVTDDDIIAEGMRQREQHAMPDQSDHSSQSADLDVAPDADEASPAGRGG